MKKSFKAILIVSLVLNGVFIVLQIRDSFRANYWSEDRDPRKGVNVEVERKNFFSSLKKHYPNTVNKKYFFINAWSPMRYGFRKELKMLDSLVKPVKNNFGYVFVSDISGDKAFWDPLKDSAKNFVFMESEESFMTSVYQEKNMMDFMGWRRRMTPINLVMDSTGKMLYFDTLYATVNMTENKILDTKFRNTLDSLFTVLK